MIGVFDSGIGGLTVVRALMDLLPEYDITYLGDTARTPYGSKSADTIIKYSLNNTAFLSRRGAKAIVIACNTASSYAYAAVKEHFKGPVFEVIGPGAQLAVDRTRKFRIGVIGTRATIASGVYEKYIKAIAPQSTVLSTACPLLVPLVEEGWLRRPETQRIVRKYLRPLKTKQIDTLILGCTHYPVLREVIHNKAGRQVTLVDSAQAIAGQVKHNLTHAEDDLIPTKGTNSRYRIFVTDTAEQFQKTARLILKKKIPIEHADIQ